MIDALSIDPREVSFYKKIAALWWDTSGPFWPLHELNKLRINWIIKELNKVGLGTNASSSPLAGLRVLDVGCGGGILSESLAQFGAQVHGIDVVEKNIRIAQLHARQNNLEIKYSYSTAESLVDTHEQYDVVFNMEVVEHVADLESFMRACNQLVKPGGAMFVATINRTFIAYLFAIIGAEYILRWLPRGTHRYAMLRKPSEIVDSLEKDNLKPTAWTGVRVNPFTRHFSLHNNKSVNYMLMAQKCL